MLWSTAVVYANHNLVDNGDFEFTNSSSSVNIPLFWNNAYSSTSTKAISTSNVKSGKKSLRLKDQGSAKVGIKSERFDVEPRDHLVLSAMVKCVNTPSPARVYIRWFDASGAYLSLDYAQTSSSSWTNLVVTAGAPANAAQAEVLLYVADTSATGDAFFDSVSVVYADERVCDNNFLNDTVGQLPIGWKYWSTSNPYAKVDDSLGINTLQLDDSSTTLPQGAYLEIPAFENVPYTFSVESKREWGSYASIYLKFYDSFGVQLASHYKSVGSSSWTTYSISRKIAPPNTDHLRILCYLSSSAYGESFFKNVSLKEDYVRKYVSPNGTGNGSSISVPAKYNSSSFWNSTVATTANYNPVKVIFAEGTYPGDLEIADIGNANKPIVLEGADRYATIMKASSTKAVRLHGLTNFTIRNMTFFDSQTAHYLLDIGQWASKEDIMTGITVEDCSLYP